MPRIPGSALLSARARLPAAAFLAAALPGGALPTASAQEVDWARVAHVADSVAYHHIAAGVAPGISVAVAVDGEVRLRRGYGVADVELGVAASPETVYRIGSITKQFTAAAIMRLVERGRLSLDDALPDLLPDYPAARGAAVTLRHLLSHTSGIRSYTSLGETFWSVSRLDLSEDELVDLFDDLEPDFEPGAEYRYNNSAYYLLGVIIGRVTGVPYARFVEDSLFAPLGLEDTYYCDGRRVIDGRAEGYEYEAGELVNAEFLSMANPGAAGALCSTVGDLVRWTELLHDGAVVAAPSLEAMTTPAVLTGGDTTSYGFGLGLAELEGRRKIAHGGGINGFISYLARYPAESLTIAVLTNSGSGDPGGIEEAIARTVFDLPFDRVADLPLTDEQLRRYVGTYVLRGGGQELEITFFVDGDRLVAQAEGQSASTLRYQGDDVFIPEFSGDVRMVFEGDGRRADAVVLHQGGGTYRGERVD